MFHHREAVFCRALPFTSDVNPHSSSTTSLVADVRLLVLACGSTCSLDLPCYPGWRARYGAFAPGVITPWS